MYKISILPYSKSTPPASGDDPPRVFGPFIYTIQVEITRRLVANIVGEGAPSNDSNAFHLAFPSPPMPGSARADNE